MWSQATWDTIRNWNTFAPWFSAIGSFAMVAITAWVTLRDKFVRFTVDTEFLDQEIVRPVIRVAVTNIGIRKLKVRSVWLTVGYFAAHHITAHIVEVNSQQVLAKILEDGDVLNINLDMDRAATDLKICFKSLSMIRRGWSANAFLRSVNVHVKPTTGKTITVPLNPDWSEHFALMFRLMEERI